MTKELDTSKFECAICFDLLLDPVVLNCGHDFCKGCLDTWRSSQPSKRLMRCPCCRSNISQTDSVPLGVCLRLRDTIESLFPEKVAARRREVAERRKLDAARLQPQQQPQQAVAVQAQNLGRQAVQQVLASLTAALSAAARRPGPHVALAPQQPGTRAVPVPPALAAGPVPAAVGSAATAPLAWRGPEPWLRRAAPIATGPVHAPAAAMGNGGSSSSVPLQGGSPLAQAALSWPSNGVAFTMGWYDSRAGQRCAGRRTRRSIRSRMRA